MTTGGQDRIRRVLLLGASRGLGLGLWERFARDGFQVTSIARTLEKAGPRPPGDHHALDLCRFEDLAILRKLISGEPFECVVYIAGIGEGNFGRLTPEAIDMIIRTNLLGALHVAQALLARNGNQRINYILIGSTCGLDNEGSPACAYVSSKFGLRGLAQALRECARERQSLYVTLLSPGSILAPGQTCTAGSPRRIAIEDIYQLIKCILALSPAALLKEASIPAIDDTDV